MSNFLDIDFAIKVKAKKLQCFDLSGVIFKCKEKYKYKNGSFLRSCRIRMKSVKILQDFLEDL